MKNKWKIIDKITGMTFEVDESWKVVEITCDLEKEHKKEGLDTTTYVDRKRQNTFLVDLA